MANPKNASFGLTPTAAAPAQGVSRSVSRIPAASQVQSLPAEDRKLLLASTSWCPICTRKAKQVETTIQGRAWVYLAVGCGTYVASRCLDLVFQPAPRPNVIYAEGWLERTGRRCILIRRLQSSPGKTESWSDIHRIGERRRGLCDAVRLAVLRQCVEERSMLGFSLAELR